MCIAQPKGRREARASQGRAGHTTCKEAAEVHIARAALLLRCDKPLCAECCDDHDGFLPYCVILPTGHLVRARTTYTPAELCPDIGGGTVLPLRRCADARLCDAGAPSCDLCSQTTKTGQQMTYVPTPSASKGLSPRRSWWVAIFVFGAEVRFAAAGMAYCRSQRIRGTKNSTQ